MLQHSLIKEKTQPNTFIDGVHVKISEQYKPPRRVILPVSCQNCSLGEALYTDYDFRLEKNVLDKMAEWKNARRQEVERRNERLKTEAKVCEEHFSNISIDEGLERTNQHLSSNLTGSVLTPICANQISPSHKPVSTNFNLSDFESDNSSPFDNMELKTINDMEVLASILSTNNILNNNSHSSSSNSNSSGGGGTTTTTSNNNNINNVKSFDKQLGEDCSVLNSKNNEWTRAPSINCSNINYFSLDQGRSVASLHQHNDLNQFTCVGSSNSGRKQFSNCELNDFSNQFGVGVGWDRAAGAHSHAAEETTLPGGKITDPEVNNLPGNGKRVPDIMHELEKDLMETKERDEECKRRNKLIYLRETILNSSLKEETEVPENSRTVERRHASTSLADPTPSLSPSSQNLVRHMSEMGFPPARAARACQMFESDDSKVIEFLLQVQSLEEKKYPGDLVEKALVVNHFQIGSSVKFLEAMMVLLDLGFDEGKAEEALIAADIDRDKALDMLIS